MKSSKDLLGQYGKLKPVVTRRYVPLMIYFFARTNANPDNCQKLFLTNKNIRMLYLDWKAHYGKELLEFAQNLVSREETESGFLQRVFTNIYNFGENLLALSQKLMQVDYTHQSTEELLGHFEEFSSLYECNIGPLDFVMLSVANSYSCTMDSLAIFTRSSYAKGVASTSR